VRLKKKALAEFPEKAFLWALTEFPLNTCGQSHKEIAFLDFG